MLPQRCWEGSGTPSSDAWLACTSPGAGQALHLQVIGSRSLCCSALAPPAQTECGARCSAHANWPQRLSGRVGAASGGGSAARAAGGAQSLHGPTCRLHRTAPPCFASPPFSSCPQGGGGVGWPPTCAVDAALCGERAVVVGGERSAGSWLGSLPCDLMSAAPQACHPSPAAGHNGQHSAWWLLPSSSRRSKCGCLQERTSVRQLWSPALSPALPSRGG